MNSNQRPFDVEKAEDDGTAEILEDIDLDPITFVAAWKRLLDGDIRPQLFELIEPQPQDLYILDSNQALGADAEFDEVLDSLDEEFYQTYEILLCSDPGLLESFRAQAPFFASRVFFVRRNIAVTWKNQHEPNPMYHHHAERVCNESKAFYYYIDDAALGRALEMDRCIDLASR